MTTSTAEHCGEIQGHILYCLDRFKAITGFGQYALREARKKGLRVQYVGKRGYILGRDFHEFVARNGRAQRGQADE